MVLQVDQDVQAVVVKSVFQTAAFAGYPNVSFMVNSIPRRPIRAPDRLLAGLPAGLPVRARLVVEAMTHGARA